MLYLIVLYLFLTSFKFLPGSLIFIAQLNDETDDAIIENELLKLIQDCLSFSTSNRFLILIKFASRLDNN